MSRNSTATKVCASIVIYKQCPETLSTLINSLLHQAEQIIIVDNNESPSLSPTDGRIVYFPNNENLGISRGHNISFQWAEKNNFTHLLTFDQDSSIDTTLIEKLLQAEHTLIDQGHNVACVGPSFIDPRNQFTAPFITLSGWKIIKKSCDNENTNFISVDYLITSGSLFNLKASKEIGYFDELLFIDYVDIEWGLRAKSMGYKLFGICDATMQHTIGDPPLKLRFINKKIPLHSPLRHYYHFRNAILIYKRPYIITKWIVNDSIRLAIKYFVYSFFAPKAKAHFTMINKGILHGVIGISGKYTTKK